MTEVDYGGGGHRTRLETINLCVYGVPPGHVYKGWREEEAGPHRARPKCGVLLGLPSLSRIPPPTWNKEKGKGEGEGRKGEPPFPSPIRTSPWGRGAATLEASLSFPVWPIKAQYEFP